MPTGRQVVIVFPEYNATPQMEKYLQRLSSGAKPNHTLLRLQLENFPH